MLTLFPPAAGRALLSDHWYAVRDGDPIGEALFLRHYSGRNRSRIGHQFVGPGQKLVLVTGDGSAVFAWRRELHRHDDQTGVNCSIFRNEGTLQSSLLIREAMAIAWERWPGERLFTFVNARAVRSTNPGYCFMRAGWTRLDTRTKSRGLIILEATP